MISAVNIQEAARTIDAWARDRERRYVTVACVHRVIDCQDEAGVKRILNRSDLCVPDGTPLVWLSWLAGHANVSRVFGPDLMLEVSAALARRNGSAFYYGGAPGVAERLATSMEARFPGLRTAGTHCPPFRELTADEDEQAAAAIDRAGADVLWVGLGAPKQEKWISRFRPRLEVPVIVGVGAAFDYNTGAIRRAPAWVQRAGLEWAYRLWQEPRRLWKRYARANPLFVYHLLCERLGLRDFSDG